MEVEPAMAQQPAVNLGVLWVARLSIYADVGIDRLMPTPRLCRPACGMKENPLFDGLFRR